MSTFEEEAKKNQPTDKLNVSMVKYFWSTGVLSSKKVKNVPRFLRGLDIFKSFSDFELKVLVNHLHLRAFSDGEVICKKGDLAFGYYIIYDGRCHVYDDDFIGEEAFLDEGDSFGELALVQENNLRTATVKANGSAVLLCLLIPDMEELIASNPKVASRLLVSLARLVTQRLVSSVDEINTLKQKIKELTND